VRIGRSSPHRLPGFLARALSLLALAGAVLLPSIPAHAAFPGGNGRIAFTVHDEAAPSWSIHTIRADGTGRALVRGNGDQAAWSADGARLAFTYNKPGTLFFHVYTMAADGSDPVQVTNLDSDDTEPGWSPDRSRIAYAQTACSTICFRGLAVIDADGSDQQTLNTDGFSPAWSPDGTRIAYGSYLGGDGDIFTVNPDGTDRRASPATPRTSPNQRGLPTEKGSRFRRVPTSGR
jgi:Tol biopolymer transport system component